MLTTKGGGSAHCEVVMKVRLMTVFRGDHYNMDGDGYALGEMQGWDFAPPHQNRG